MENFVYVSDAFCLVGFAAIRQRPPHVALWAASLLSQIVSE
jgi:hypothetical protein